jgi:hypothetical protein
MIVETLRMSTAEFAARTGWAIKPQGACKGDACVPLGGAVEGETVDVRAVAERLGMAVVRDDAAGAWAIGPESGGRALTTVEAPGLELPDHRGETFALRSLRGQKVLLLAWASW